jgi:hypothetical protein
MSTEKARNHPYCYIRTSPLGVVKRIKTLESYPLNASGLLSGLRKLNQGLVLTNLFGGTGSGVCRVDSIDSWLGRFRGRHGASGCNFYLSGSAAQQRAEIGRQEMAGSSHGCANSPPSYKLNTRCGFKGESILRDPCSFRVLIGIIFGVPGGILRSVHNTYSPFGWR